MAIFDNIKCYNLQCPKKVRHAIFMIANQMKNQLEKLWFWVTSIVKLKKDTE